MIPGTPTRANACVDRLLELLKAGRPDTQVEVLDGDLPLDDAWDAIMVAPADPDTPGVFCTYGRDPSLGNAPVEQVEVAIVVRSYSGDSDMAPRRARCEQLVEGIFDIVRQHRVEQGIWDRIEMGPNAAWHPVYTDKGVNCFVGLSVVCTGLL